MRREEGKILFLTVTFSICREMLNAIYESKRCNRFVIIPWRNTSSIPRINWGSFRGRREEKWGSFRGRFGDHFRVGDHFGVGIISGAVQSSDFLKRQTFVWEFQRRVQGSPPLFLDQAEVQRAEKNFFETGSPLISGSEWQGPCPLLHDNFGTVRPRGEIPHMKGVGMLVGTFELNP